MTDEPEQEAEADVLAGGAERDDRPWWFDADGLIGVGFRLDVLRMVGMPVEMSPEQYERMLSRVAYWAAVGEWPNPPKKPDLKPIPGGKG